MNSQKIIEQIRKLFNREAGSKPEVDELNLWYQSLNEQTAIPENLSEIKSDSWNIILEKTHPIDRHLKKNKHPFLKDWLWKAAIFLGICFTSYGLLSTFSEEETPVKLAAGVYTNDIGKVSTFFLPDGSEIWMSTGSELEYAEDFSRNRKVKLTGEAFFKVKRNPDFPFQITTGAFFHGSFRHFF
ncbi:FecR domain-containing protein [Cyclobacterium qasimii]|uniref:Putative anti-sigma factor n=1 Tax=Cyclobacterium qasimii M12-11B TaxID=641524 RepID=S7WQJ4_9BACT|nr:FecR family protein [Cyclobacterium qasimii]EPR66393.1 putative anti-sigma factor [Cyclobacterium qasimii M12-11B]